MSYRPLRAATGVLPILRLALVHSLHNVRLLAPTLLGLVIAAGLASSVPLFAYGAQNRLLEARVNSLISLPPDVVWTKVMFNFPTPEDPQRYLKLDDFVTNNTQAIIGLPQRQLVRFVGTETLLIWPWGPNGPDFNYPQRRARLVFQNDFLDHVWIAEGQAPPDGAVADGAEVPVLMSREAADALDLELDEKIAYTNFDGASSPVVPLRVVGIWEPLDPGESYWLYDPASYNTALIVDREALLTNVVPKIPGLLKELSWYGVYDQSRLSSLNAERVLSGLEYLQSQTRAQVSSATVDTTLRQTLPEYLRQAYILSSILLVLSVPTIAVVLYFVGIAMGMVVERHRAEIALLKSRGASTLQVSGIYLFEGIFLGVVALVVGPLLGGGIAQIVGQTVGFMQFARRPAVALGLNLQALELAGGVALIALPAIVQPAVGAARQTIVSYKQEVARSSQRASWLLLPIAVTLLVISAYGYYLLRQNQSILPLKKGESFVIDPLLVIVPAVFIFGAALLLLQLYPLVTAGLARLVGVLPGRTASLSLAFRQVARTPKQHSALVLLLTLALALGAYSASTAQTIDRNIGDQVRYAVPGDLDLSEIWPKSEDGGYLEEPLFENHYVAGVEGAVPYLSYKVTPPPKGRTAVTGQLLAIDRLEYPKGGWWRDDFAEKPLGALMNALGANPAATIVSRSFVKDYGLKVGDNYTLQFEGNSSVEFYIAEVADYFPTLYPEKGPFFVANLEYIFDQVGIQPYNVWVNVSPGARSVDVVDAMRTNGVGAIFMQDSRVAIGQTRNDPQRTGLFGVLTVGFGVAALLAVLSFFLYSSLSFRRRLVQMGILRAMGLSTGQLFLGLFLEQVLLVALGVAFGTGLGLATNSLFIPFLQLGAEGQTPRFVVQTPWADLQRVYVVLGLMLLVGLGSTAWLVRRLKLYQVVKMGEEQ